MDDSVKKAKTRLTLYLNALIYSIPKLKFSWTDKMHSDIA